MDDVSLGTETVEQHLESLDSALATCFEAGTRLQLSKCQFGVRSAQILGHRVNENGLRPSDAHIDAIRGLVEPGGGEELMRFLGLVIYFSGFVDHFADIAAPLYAVLRGTPFNKKKKRGQRLIIHDWHVRWGETQRSAGAEGETEQSRDPGDTTAACSEEAHDRCKRLRARCCFTTGGVRRAVDARGLRQQEND